MSPALHAAPRLAERAHAPLKTVVVVDDYVDLLEVTAMLLEEQGYRVLTAADGAEGLELALRHHADLVLLDYAMPRMNGADVGRCLRARDAEGAMKIVMSSATPEAQVRREFPDYDCFLRKPTEPRQLVDEVAALLAA